MDSLHDLLEELADEAPTGGAPPAELWARGKRAYRVRGAAVVIAVLVVGAVGVGISVRLAGGDADGDRTAPVPAATTGAALPIAYPVGGELPDLGQAPGPLAAIWVAPTAGGGALEAVGLVADTRRFGTLGLDLPSDEAALGDDVGVALSPDGRRVAYDSAKGDLTVRDLVTGETYSPLSTFKTRPGYVWSDTTHLFGHVAGGADTDAWVWEPGTTPKRIDQLTYVGDANIRPHGVGRDVWVVTQGGGTRSCTPPTLENFSERWEVPQLCDVLGIFQSGFLLGHGNSDRLPGDLNSNNRTVVAVSLRGQRMVWNGRALPTVVVTSAAPERVALATDLIGQWALDAQGGMP